MDTLPGKGNSLWHATAPEAAYPALEGDRRADVAVVGGGLAGLTTALLLAQRGVDVVVLEARTLASGVTGHTTGKVTSQHGLLYSELVSKHGEAAAAVYGLANQAAVEQVALLVEQGGIDCAFERRPAYTYTNAGSLVSRIEHEVEVATRLGLPASFAQETDLPYDVLGAIRFDDQAQFHVMHYCHGLAEMITAAGGAVYQHTRVTDVQDSSPLRVVSDAGTVSADAVVLATHLPILDRGLYFAKAEPSATYGIAAHVDAGAPEGMYISAESPTRSVRSYVHDGQPMVVVVGESHRTGEGGDEREHWQALIDFTQRSWPGSRVAYRWFAEDYVPQDLLPYIGRLSRTSGPIYVATGFQKWGLSNGTVAAMILADLVTGQPHAWAKVFDSNRLTPLASAKKFVEHNLKAAVHFVRDRTIGEPAEAAESLEPGQGVLVRHAGRQYAVSKDEQGKVHTRSAVCTHLGCIVAWNEAHRSWDCPCHGSRYGPDGSVLEGPAVRGLDEAELPPGQTSDA